MENEVEWIRGKGEIMCQQIQRYSWRIGKSTADLCITIDGK